MSEIITAIEPLLRLGAVVVLFAGLAMWEISSPRRPLVADKRRRWTANLTLVALNTALLRVAFPTAAVGVAAGVAAAGWGVLPALGITGPAALVLAVVLLDLAIYAQHRLFHNVPLLWRLHRMHHADPDLDVTSGTRFHPAEIALSMGIKIVLIAALGAPVAAVLAFEVLLNLVAMFNHSNIDLPIAADRVLRRFVVTPDMHRVHHSAVPREHHSNFGFNLSIWDRLFGTYVAQPARGHSGMTIGLDDVGAGCAQSLWCSLKMPFSYR